VPQNRRNGPAAVYPVREDSRLLARFATPRPGDRFLEVGCGRGLASLVAARHGPGLVVATDLNPTAVRTVYERARKEGLSLEAVRTNLAAGLRAFDLILSNPPYLPTAPKDRDPDRWENLALDGGPDGLRVTRRLLASLPKHLTSRGRAYVLFSSRQPSERVRQLLQSWRAGGGRARWVAAERWGDETLSIWRLSRASRRSGRSIRGRRGRRRAPPRDRSASSPGVGSGRKIARGVA
jgi:release factor glutamine methyltransferase